MSQPFTIPPFTDEELEFRPWYLKLPTAREHLLALQEWRRRQSRIVGSLGQIIGHFGGEQYTEVDHFLLELLQNADDNTFAPGVTPEMTITLEPTCCIFTCNEVGFSADNVFSICYAAASTKKREPGKRSFIGEKGIGFKSLFAVAEAVEIHSGDYHFELRDQEYIVPHLLDGARESGSRIVVRFRSGMEEIAALLSKRLGILSQNADHFVLFLQKLEKLTVTDKLSETTNTVEIERDGERCAVQQGSDLREYRMVSETIEFPEAIVRDRFKHLSGPLSRDVRFAVPYPKELAAGLDAGLLFCFLPTRVVSGFSFHIQIDGKTTTNRENIESSARSKWNKHLMEKLPIAILNLFLNLRDDKEFTQDLPLYFPDPKAFQTGNDDLNTVLKVVAASIPINKFAPDRNSNYLPVGALRLSPAILAEFIETDQYAEKLGKYGETNCEFLHPNWRKHVSILSHFGCGVLMADQLAELFVKGGCPQTVAAAKDEQIPRAFLDKWITLKPTAGWETTKLKAAPIYPLKDGQLRSFGSIAENTLLVSLDGRDIPVPAGSVILDPLYTYTPGGNVDEGIRGFNERFRTYLTGVLKMERYSDAKYLEDVFIPSIQAECENPVVSDEERLAHTERWSELFSRVWWREKTIVGDSSPDRFQKMLLNIGQCRIITGARQESGWATVPLNEAFLPALWWQDQNLAKTYEQASAPMISLAFDKLVVPTASRAATSESKINPQEWIAFFSRCGAAQGPRLVEIKYPLNDSLSVAVKQLGEECDRFPTNGRQATINTTDFDSATCRLLAVAEIPEHLTVAIARLWPTIAYKKTHLTWYYYYDRSHSLSNNAARCRVTDKMPLLSDQGLVSAKEAVLDNEQNGKVGRGLIPMIDPNRYTVESFLLFLGVSEKIDEEWLDAKAQLATQQDDDEIFQAKAGTVMRMAARLARDRPEGRTWIRTARIFAHRTSRELLTYDEWIGQKGDLGFPEAVANEVLDSLESVTESSVPALINELFELADLAGRNNQVVNWLKGVGSDLRTGRKNEIALEFASQLRNRGLMYHGQTIKEPAGLPALWDIFPNPCSAAAFIVLPDEQTERSLCVLAAIVLNWPRLSAKTIQAQFVSRDEIDDVTRKQIQMTAEVLDSKFSVVPGNRPTKSPLMRLAREGKLLVFEAKDIALKIDECVENPEVEFWFAKGELFFDPEKINLPEALGRMIDFQASTTVAPFIESIFEGQETAAKQAIARQRTPQPLPPAPVPPAPAPVGTPPVGGNGTAPPPPEPPSGARKRLYSYVGRSGDGKAKLKPQAAPTSSTGSQAKTDVELAGEKMLIEFCARHGLGCKDVTAENKGYDFEVKAINGEYMVELKSSRDQWQHWENAMTPNEFKSAIQHQDNYILCVAEQVLDASGSLIFIQNPWGQADYFLFDSPWKKVKVDPAQLFSILEDAPGAPPERPEEI